MLPAVPLCAVCREPLTYLCAGERLEHGGWYWAWCARPDHGRENAAGRPILVTYLFRSGTIRSVLQASAAETPWAIARMLPADVRAPLECAIMAGPLDEGACTEGHS
jgi:hypothetical protein